MFHVCYDLMCVEIYRWYDDGNIYKIFNTFIATSDKLMDYLL